mmetsp:Transcript_17442/g.41908  ORF Transcript_17442/g.41908 Transcript_17442/m.41908 type:complete len:349 (-) Transcript_17442:205-1251(-)
MKRPAAIAMVVILLASFPPGSHGKPCGFLPSAVDTSISIGSSGRVRRENHISTKGIVRRSYDDDDAKHNNIFATVRIVSHSDAYVGRRKRMMVLCHTNKNNNAPGGFGKKNKDGDEEFDAQEESTKRGVFERVRDKISTTFGGNKRGERQDVEGDGEIGYKPNPLDAIRLRLAMAMSGLSNKMNLFQFGKETWVVACPKTKVGPGQIIPCTVNGLDIIIFASRDGQRLDAFANACPHLGSPFDLATTERKPVLQDSGRTDDGKGDGCVDCIVCPVHRTAFEIQSGKVRGEWCPYPPIIGNVMGLTKPKTDLVKFAVRLKGKNVEVRIATSVKNVGKGEEQADGVQGIK